MKSNGEAFFRVKTLDIDTSSRVYSTYNMKKRINAFLLAFIL
jgi:hypothetical protein